MAVALKPPSRAPELSWAATWPREELLITLIYIGVGAAWIVGSDLMLGRWTADSASSLRLQTFKGLNFILTTAVLFYLILRRSYGRRRRAEEASRISQERFELVARAATDAIWDWNLKTNSLWWSDGFYLLFGYAEGEVPPTLGFWEDCLHPDERERVTAGLNAVAARGGQTWADEYRFRRKDGGYAFVQDRGYLIRDAAGKPERMVGGMTDITARKKAEHELERSRRQLRGLTARLQSSREEERTRIAREIHDELGQLLTALKMDLRWMEKKLSQPEAGAALNVLLEKTVEAGEIVDSTIAAVQRIAAELRPSALDTLGLAPALRLEASRFQERTGVKCNVTLPERDLDLPTDAATVVFRIFQETLTNVARHAQATEVRAVMKEENERIVLEVDDNGAGISPEALANAKSLGLLGMKERAAVLGGEVSVQPGPQSGTRVRLWLPRAANDTRFWEQL